MSAQVWFAQDEIAVQPGQTTSLSLAIENVGDRTESYTIIPAGFTAGWTTVSRGNITLFGGSRDVVEVLVRPPALHSTTAGPTGLAIRVIPQSAPDDAVIAETVVGVRPFDDRRITTLQPVQRGRRRATFEFMVENHGNNLASCRLHLVDATNRVDGTFDPPAVGVAPGASSLVRLHLRAQHRFFRRNERQLEFEIDATEPDHDPAAGRATLIQPSSISGSAIWRTAAVLATLAAVVAAWFAVVRPELDDAVDRAVDARIADIGAVPSGTVPETVASTSPSVVEVPVTPDAATPPADEGEPVAYRIAVDVGVTQERSESIAIPPDSRFLLTDIVLQNPNGDLGSAQLLRNGDILYQWNLGEMEKANEFQPRISPLPFEPSDNVVLAVSCDVVGQTVGTGCEIAVLLGGRLVVPGA
ncbi:MAG: hypothetical protein ABIO83_00510 [Ilumatobacteraceae bacterium]